MKVDVEGMSVRQSGVVRSKLGAIIPRFDCPSPPSSSHAGRIGMEEQVLRGATGIIMQHRPTLYVENNRDAGSPSVVRYLVNTLRYKCFWYSHVPLPRPRSCA